MILFLRYAEFGEKFFNYLTKNRCNASNERSLLQTSLDWQLFMKTANFSSARGNFTSTIGVLMHSIR